MFSNCKAKIPSRDYFFSTIFPVNMDDGIIAGLRKQIFRDIMPAVANEYMASSTSGLGRSPLKAKTRVRTSLRLPKIEINSLRRKSTEAFIIPFMIYN